MMRRLYRFDDVVLDLEAFRLTRSGQPVHLEPKVLELLGYLVSNRGRLVEKPELQAAVWRDTAVSDSALTRAVAQLRKALDDDAREARYVETVPTRGYRFRPEVPVREGRNGSGQDPAPEPGTPSLEGAPSRRRVVILVVGAALVSAFVPLILSWWSPSRRHLAPTREAHRALVSTTRGYNAFPAFSPDGSTLAFASDRSGRLEIYMRPLAPGAREAPVTADGQDNVQPAWSPDGRYLAYHSLRRGGLWLTPTLGGPARQVAEFGSAPAWSPDGRRLAFSSLGLAALEGVIQQGAALWLVDVVDGEPAPPRRLTETGRPPSGHGPPVFSPDGREVFFVAEGLWAVSSDGSGEPRQVVEGSVADVALSPDGRSLYWSGWERGNWHVWQAPLRPGVARAGPRTEILNAGDQAPRHLRVSRAGRLAVALTSFASDVALLPVGPDGSPTGPAREGWPGAGGRKLFLHFSRDGSRLAVARTQAGQGLEVWGLEVATGATRSLLPATDLSFLNGWFPGDQALLVTGRSGGTKTMLRAPLSGGRSEALRPADTVGWARLLPSGEEMVFHSVTDGVLNVHRSRLDGSASQRLTHDLQGVGWPVPSPDGRTLAVEIFRGNDAHVALMPAEGGALRPITRMPGQHWGHDWSPDGRRVLYAARRDGLWNVYWMDVESGEERRLTDNGRVREAVRTPAWSPRGDRIAYERLEVTSSVWVVDLEGQR